MKMRLDQGLLNNERRKLAMDSSLTIVNIVLLLLLFFIATGSVISSGDLKVELPFSKELPLDLLPKPLLQITDDGSMLLDGVLIPSGALSAKTVDYPVLHIVSDRDTKAKLVLETLATEQLVAVELRLVTIHRASE